MKPLHGTREYENSETSDNRTTTLSEFSEVSDVSDFSFYTVENVVFYENSETSES